MIFVVVLRAGWGEFFFSGGADLGFENKFPRNEKNEPEEVLWGETMTADGGVYAIAINGQMDGRMDGLKVVEGPCARSLSGGLD